MNTTQVLATLYRQSFRKKGAHCHCSIFWMQFWMLADCVRVAPLCPSACGLATSELIEPG